MTAHDYGGDDAMQRMSKDGDGSNEECVKGTGVETKVMEVTKQEKHVIKEWIRSGKGMK